MSLCFCSCECVRSECWNRKRCCGKILCSWFFLTFHRSPFLYIFKHRKELHEKNNTFILVYFRTNTWSSTRMVSTFHELLLFYIYNLFLKSCDVVLIYTWTKKCHQDLSKSLKHYILAYSLKCGAKTFLQVHVYLYAWGYFFGENPFSTCQSFLNLLAFRNTLRALFYDFPIGDEGC